MRVPQVPIAAKDVVLRGVVPVVARWTQIVCKRVVMSVLFAVRELANAPTNVLLLVPETTIAKFPVVRLAPNVTKEVVAVHPPNNVPPLAPVTPIANIPIASKKVVVSRHNVSIQRPTAVPVALTRIATLQGVATRRNVTRDNASTPVPVLPFVEMTQIVACLVAILAILAFEISARLEFVHKPAIQTKNAS